jgi:hypothetical protein
MTKTEIDVLWNRALREAIEGGEEFTRYRFAAMVASAERTRADALAATIAALRDIVTSDAESKDDFIARVRAVLGACPDQRVLQAVEAEREACAKVCETEWSTTQEHVHGLALADMIRDRANP